MSNFVLLFLCLGIGYLLKKSSRFPSSTAHVLNAFVIQISFPAVVMTQVPALLEQEKFDLEMLIPISMAWLLFILSCLFFSLLGKKLRWTPAVLGAVILTAGLGNTSFVGFPVLESLIGPHAIRIGVLVDQLGSFFVLSTLGILLASRLGIRSRQTGTQSEKVSLIRMARHIAFFPPFIALITACLWWMSGLYGPSIALTVFEKLGATLIPLALVAVGYQISITSTVLSRQWKPLAWGLGFKLIIAPAVLSVLFIYGFSSHALSTHITLLEAAMAPMITASVVAVEFGLCAELATLMVGVGIPISLITVPLWHLLLLKIM